jgi:hypothetical protein
MRPASQQTWQNFLETPPEIDPPNTSPPEAQQWKDLIAGLRHSTQTAALHELPLPEPLGVWAAWLLPVGRLSFPTGRLITTLDREQPSRLEAP